MLTIALLFILWVVGVVCLKRLNLHFFKFVVGSIGLFGFMMVLGRNSIEKTLSYSVAWVLGALGDKTGLFSAFPDYSMISVRHGFQTVSFFIDYECSGFIETLVYFSLLVFFPVYTRMEKVKYLTAGTLYIFAANVLRVLLICGLVKAAGTRFFFFTHTVFARLLFFGLVIILYYFVFTRPHIQRQRVGDLNHATG